MPFVTIDHFAGIADQDRRRLQERLAAVVIEHFAAPASNVRVFTRAVDPADVYVADGNREAGLPIIRVEFLPGRSLEQKRAVVKGLAREVAEILKVPADRLRIVLSEKDRHDWARGETLVGDA